ncbi:homeobox protein 2-like isoform X2 [Eurosta solidaginis]|uniref:homeobox protein 2-like isoform X2 n=1 Tax=Eurosta solidaginis TaxID=178769 RepID=UPI003530FCA8
MQAKDSMNAERGFLHQRKPPDVEEALSSMLWTPYEHTSTDSSSDEDDQIIRTERIHRLHNNYNHKITNQPLTSTYFGDDSKMGLSVALTTTPTKPDVANRLQSTPFVPFSNVSNSNNINNNDNASCSRNHWYPVKPDSIRKESRNGSFQFSYPYYGPHPSFNKWRSPSVSSKEPPSYESLYTNGPAALVVAQRYDAIFKDYKAETNKGELLNSNDTLVYKRRRSLELLGPLNFEVGTLLSSSSEKVTLCAENVSQIERENCYKNTDGASKQQSSGDTPKLKETRPTNSRSQQTKEYNDLTINNFSIDRNENYVLKSRKQKEERNPQTLLQLTSLQSSKAARAESTNKSVKGTESEKTISHSGEEVNQPVSCADSSKTFPLSSDLRTSVVNIHTNNNNNESDHIVPNTRPMNSDAFPNNEIQMNNTAMNPLNNLFDVSRSDKATSTESSYGKTWQCMYDEHRTIPTVVDTDTIIQSSACSLNGHVNAHKSRSTFATLQSYSHLWKTAFKGVRTKVKRATRSSSASVHVPSNVAPLDTLTPNKCLAELERLYAEFWASESALAAARGDVSRSNISEHRSNHCFNLSPSDCGDDSDYKFDFCCEVLRANSSYTVSVSDWKSKMRLNIPAAADKSFLSPTRKLRAQQMQNIKVLPTNSNSSIILTSSDCTAICCLTSNGNSVSDDDRFSNFLHETKNNYSDCVNNVINHKINNNNEEDNDVAIVQNDCVMGNNDETMAKIATPSSINRTLSTVTIQVNSGNNDQNNNNNCINNKNNAECSNTNNYFEDNDYIGVEGHLVNLNIGPQEKSNIVKSNAVSVVNCNYSSIYTISNEYKNTNNNNASVCNLSATTTPVCSVNVNKSVNHVSPVRNVFCNGKTSATSDNIIGVHAVKNDYNGNDIRNGCVTDNVNIINLSSQPQSTEMNTQEVYTSEDSPTCVPHSKSASSTALPYDRSHSPKTASVVVSEQSRTFASTECQTDEILSVQLRNERAPISPISQRAQRRSNRRERRHLQQQLSSSYPHPHQLHTPSPLRHSVPLGSEPLTSIGTLHIQPNAYHAARSTATTMPAAMSTLLRPMLPDLLHIHFPPPYSASLLNGAITSSASPTIVGSVPPPGTTILTSMISMVPMPNGAPPVVNDGRFTLPLPIIRRSPSERSGKDCCGQLFAGPPLRAVIAVVALGGIACALGGAALVANGLSGPPSSHFTAAFLMLGVGVVLVTVSGAAWHMTTPGGPPCLGFGSSVDLGRYGRRQCQREGGTADGILYPEFQHRPPPPSYQASMQEYRLRAPLTSAIKRGTTTGSVAGISEYSLPPSYRSRNSNSAIISSEREIPSSVRLMTGQCPPEPSIIEQLPKNNNTESSLRTQSEHSSISKSTPISYRQVRPSAIVEIETSNSINRRENQLLSKSESETDIAGATNTLTSTTHKDLVTIVTISKSDPLDGATQGEHIEILAHL